MKYLIILLTIITSCSSSSKINKKNTPPLTGEPIPAAYRTNVYFPMLKGKRVAVFANHTSLVGSKHLVDTLLAAGINVVKAFGPEHGFRGTADAGEKVDNYIDKRSGVLVVSLYGKKSEPSKEDLADVDILVFDLQDVGARYYTYINALEHYMNAAFENSKPLLVLDRPNPNGFYVDGPSLDTAYRSGVGHMPIPTMYGMTIGEYGFMIAGEKWLSPKANEKYEYYKCAENSVDTPFHFQVIKCSNYDHNSRYDLPVKPSPNIPDFASVFWYGSTCFFEGTALNEGRGTDYAFCIFGHPSLPKNLYKYTPTSREGAKEPKLLNQICYGWNLYDTRKNIEKFEGKVHLKYLLDAYHLFPNKDSFWLVPAKGQYFFDKLAGDDNLRKQIIAGKTEAEIKASWQPKLNAFKATRKKYLLYKDFE